MGMCVRKAEAATEGEPSGAQLLLVVDCQLPAYGERGVTAGAFTPVILYGGWEPFTRMAGRHGQMLNWG